ncbi:MAG: DUF1015 domain-containing protein [Ruminococcaceae bacterium]|nr:DUF1015 domain-containing protein [Oscillospiraceae bacterium]
MKNKVFSPADILLPQGCDMEKWAVVACDQYTSEPEYWAEADELVGKNPSTLRLMLPELYLESDDVAQRIEAVHTAMEQMLAKDVLQGGEDSYIYVERTQRNGKVRRGIVGKVDLECYSYEKGSVSPIRATEGTILERIPPRRRVREGGALELPHIMLLIDDPDCTVIEPLMTCKDSLCKQYDFDLMMNSGHIAGYTLSKEEQERVDNAIAALAEPERLVARYGDCPANKLLFAVGDGNHSLATAKACYEAVKERIGADAALNHPARYALCEVVNLHDTALEFEAIHRVVFEVDEQKLIDAMTQALGLVPGAEGQQVRLCVNGKVTAYAITKPASRLAVGSVQAFLDDYLAKNSGRVDYIHGDDVVAKLCAAGNVGMMFDAISKDELFAAVVADGALPRKTFSMGEAADKRFYLEARKIL